MLGKFNRGPITSLKKIYLEATPEHQYRLLNIYIIHSPLYLRTRISFIRTCFKGYSFLRKVTHFTTLFSFLGYIKSDPALS